MVQTEQEIAKPENRSTDFTAFLRLLHPPGSIFEIRAPQCPVDPGRDFKRTASGYFSAAENARDEILRIGNDHRPPGIYVTLNHVDSSLLARSTNKIIGDAKSTTADSDILQRRWLILDIDPTRPAGVSATEAEMRAALDLADGIRHALTAEGWPAPVRGMSGNGSYLLYRIDLPNDDDSRELVRDVLRGLADRFDTDAAKIDRSTFNAARIVKVLGTPARKGSDLQGVPGVEDRPHRISWFVPPAGELSIVSRELLAVVAVKPVPTPDRSSASNGRGGLKITDRCRKYIAKIPDAVSGDDGHGKTLRAACDIARFGIDGGEAMNLLREFNAAKCSPPWSDRELEHKLRDGREKVEAAGEFGSLAPRNGHSRITVAPVADLDALSPSGQTELANARRFIQWHQDRVRYCFAWKKWVVWDGTRWKLDDDGAVLRLVRDVADFLWKIALETGDAALMKFAVASSKASHLQSVLALAAAEVPIAPTEMDANPWLFNCPNGTVDLRTGELREHRREDCITQLCPTPFDPEAETYLWDRFIEDLFVKTDLIEFQQRHLGSCLAGIVRDHILAIWYGSGSNGKSTLIELLMQVLGDDYVFKAPFDLLLKKRGSHPTERAALFRKRFVACVETNDGRHFDEATMKELTGGDTVTARKMREDFWSFTPTHKLVLATNHKPRVEGTDLGVWRRLRLVPFTQKFEGDKCDPALKEKLVAIAPGILAWLVQGCLDWQRVGLNPPPEVMEATKEYRKAEDVIQSFIEEACTVHSNATCRAGELHSAFENWGKHAGEKTVGSRAFKDALLGKGFQQEKHGWVTWYGIGLLATKHSGKDASAEGESDSTAGDSGVPIGGEFPDDDIY